MTLLIGLTILAAITAVWTLTYFVRKVGRSANLPATSDWIEDLSLERYRPMLRMLDDGDIEFLRSQPGFTPRMAAKLRAQRTRIFKGYLTSLEGDFARVCSAIKLIMLQSRHDRPELAETLVKQQMTFACGMLRVRASLVLYRLGGCAVDVTELVRLFDSMRVELRTLVPAGSAAGV